MDLLKHEDCPVSTEDENTTCSMQDIPQVGEMVHYVHTLEYICGPCIILWTVIPLYLFHLFFHRKKLAQNVNLGQIKMYLLLHWRSTMFLATVTVAWLSRQHKESDTLTNWQVSAYLDWTHIGAYILVAVVIKLERNKEWVNSNTYFLFWLLMLTSSGFNVYHNILKETYTRNISSFIFYQFYLYGVMAQFVLVVIRDKGHKELSEDTDQFIHPEEKASLASRLFFNWVTRLVRKGYTDDLKEKDIPELQKQDRCETVYPHFDQAWRRDKLKLGLLEEDGKQKERMKDAGEQMSVDSTESEKATKSKKMKKSSLLYIMFRAYGTKYILYQVIRCIFELSQFTSPVLLEALMKYMEKQDTEPMWKGYALAMTMFLVTVVKDILQTQFGQVTQRLLSHMTMVLREAVFKKALTARNESRQDKTTGELVSLINEDVDKLVYSSNMLYFILVTPAQVCLALYMLYRQLEMGAFAGLGVMLCLIPFNVWVGRKIHGLQKGRTKFKDERIKVINEILNGIKVLKLYAWEESFIGKVKEIRQQEVANYKSMKVLHGCVDLMFSCIPLLVRLAGFLVFIMMGGHLDPARAFVTANLFDILSSPFNFMAFIIPQFVQASISLQRVSDFLYAPDIRHDVVVVDKNCDSAIHIQNGTFTWSSSADKTTLTEINLEIPQGELVAVVGMVGSGKSSLLSAMLGEMEKLEGKVTVQSTVAYVSQESWIQNATVRDNILFGSDFEADRYQQVIHGCALKEDLKILIAGDKTEIGEKGINLSGGQKQRVALGRAVYNDADIYLLDDPLSAVDAHVGKHIFNNVIGHNGMLKNKTRVLVTHGVHWLPFVDKIIVMTEGRISESGTYKQLLSHNGAFAKFLKELFSHTEEESDTEVKNIKVDILRRLSSLEGEMQEEGFDRDLLDKELFCVDEALDASSCNNDSENNVDANGTVDDGNGKRNCKIDNDDDNNDDDDDDDDSKRGKIIEDESVQSGRVSPEVYKEYARAVGLLYILVFVVIFSIMLLSREFKSLWLGKWAEDPLLANTSLINTTEYQTTLWMYISVYGFSGALEVLLAFIFSVALEGKTYEAASQLHSRLLTRVMQMPMSFFDTTPTGRIMSRFSKDIGSVDRLGGCLEVYIRGIGSLIMNLLMIIYIKPAVILFILPVSFFYIYMERMFTKSNRLVYSWASKHSSPVSSHIKETLNGLATVRAFRVQDRFVANLEAAVEKHTKFLFTARCMSEWFYMRIMLLSESVALAGGLIILWDRSISPSMAWLVLTSSTGFVNSLSWFVSHSTYTERELASLERVLEYVNKPAEAAWEIPEQAPPPNWPQSGEICLDDLKLRYRDGLDLVLHGVTCNIHGGEKIGIVGRTGAGKSSLMVALFRLVEAASGQIRIDGEQIASLGLHDLRKKITILPQDPVIFGGTLRMNLDPFNEKSSEELWEALKHSHLHSFVESLPDNLDYECGEGGKNLSVGQRQLVCLARTLLRKTRVLVLDEATAAVDMETDELIQKTICSEFKDCTVLTIAHRLNTIMNYDRILVMEQGQVREFDSPKNLLTDQSSLFYSMARDANLVS